VSKAGTKGTRDQGTKKTRSEDCGLFRLLLAKVPHRLDFVPDVVVPEILSHDMMVM